MIIDFIKLVVLKGLLARIKRHLVWVLKFGCFNWSSSLKVDVWLVRRVITVVKDLRLFNLILYQFFSLLDLILIKSARRFLRFHLSPHIFGHTLSLMRQCFVENLGYICNHTLFGLDYLNLSRDKIIFFTLSFILNLTVWAHFQLDLTWR